MPTHFPAHWMTLQGTVNIAYSVGVVIMSPLGPANNTVDTILFIPNTVQMWKETGQRTIMKIENANHHMIVIYQQQCVCVRDVLPNLRLSIPCSASWK